MRYFVLAAAALIALVMAACGGADPTATSSPPAATPPAGGATPTSAPAATPTPAPTPRPTTAPSATATAAAPTPAPTPRPTATPPPPTLPGKYGGVLQTRSNGQYLNWDSFDTRGQASFHHNAPVFNNLIFVDPYGDGKSLVGDAAERWEYADAGRSLTFFIRKGIKWHDGTPFTSEDVAYNFDRAAKPRSTTMTFMKNRLSGIQKIDTPDDLTVRITLKDPSNAFIMGAGMVEFQMFPARLPFPEKYNEWKAKPIGTGPFKFKSFEQDVKLEFVRNDGYWKPGLPYLDGNVVTNMSNETCTAAFRAGKIDLTMFDPNCMDDQVQELKRGYSFISTTVITALNSAAFIQRPPWTDPRAREAVDLALDRQAMVNVLLGDRATPWNAYSPPLLPPEMGGAWGLSAEAMKQRPGFRADKTQDRARARELLAQAGIDPKAVTVTIIGRSGANFTQAEVADASLRELGFKVQLVPLESLPLGERQRKGDFDMEIPQIGSSEFDDPMDVLATWYMTGGSRNIGNWSDPQFDALFVEQDKVLDIAKRKALLIELQQKVLDTRWAIPIMWRTSSAGTMPWAKNYPLNLPFLFQQRYRHEQIWLQR